MFLLGHVTSTQALKTGLNQQGQLVKVKPPHTYLGLLLLLLFYIDSACGVFVVVLEVFIVIIGFGARELGSPGPHMC